MDFTIDSPGQALLYGIDATIDNYGTGSSYGGYFQVNDVGTGYKYAVRGIATGTHSSPVYGVNGRGQNDGSGDAYGVYGIAMNSGTGTKYGVYGSEAAGGTGAAVYASGDQIASGTKSAVIRTSQGEKLMYAVEATEVWFEHIGRHQLNNGHAHIELDPLFLETVDVSLAHPMQVFVQLNSDCNGTYVTTGATGFDVHELQNGTGNITFTYRVMAKRKGYAVERMRETDVGKYDVNLYPERKAEIESYWNEQKDQNRRPVRFKE